ncbi:HAMP domain-containing histidine kinase [Rossellomorea aquimaris]|uniref:HAMP domain-containing sensor histidine kinase n=1 Tax=Rossellomorea aquimaris TaxID=189382 RepID=UPI001CD5DEEC|nr:HAMP domain-containing histidine kinase [Rossellomorea aquimaris]MCA1053965.1 HAMP domain-containing histidine kinase [Rossellomorea aquimaris]
MIDLKSWVKPTSLKVKWALAAGSAIFLAFFLFSFFQYHAINKWMLDEEENNFSRVLDEITVFFKQRGPNVKLQDIYESRDLMKQIAEKDQTIRILDRQGKQALEIRGENEPAFYIPFQPVRDKTVNLIESDGKKVLIGHSPIVSRQFNGYVEIIQPLNRYENIMKNLFWMMSITGIAALLLSALLGYLMARSFIRPLNKLSEAMRSIERNGFQRRVETTNAHDEISELSQIFNKMMSEIEKSFRQQQQFVEDASHELRTPIQVLEGHLALLNRWGKKDPTILEESLQVSLEELDRVKRLVGELLELSRADRELTDYENARVDLEEVSTKIIRDFAFLHEDYRFELVNELKNSEDAFMLKRHLEQILVILLDNAVKYSESHTMVKVRLFGQEDRLVLEVKDEGIGIPEEDLQKVFDRFYRVDKARSREKGGYGLGLAIASKLIFNYGGTIEASNNQPTGTIIRVSLKKAMEHTNEV